MTKKFKVGILDDEPKALTLIEHFIKNDPEFEVTFLEENPSKAYDLAIQHEVNLFITDIHMPITNGIWVAQQMIENNIPVAITSGVWASSHMCINMDIVGFIHKPISKKGISDLLVKFKKLHASKFVNPSNRKDLSNKYYIKNAYPFTLHAINPDDIIYLKGGKDYTEIYYLSNSQIKKFLHNVTLHNFIHSFENSFFMRIHKSYVINTKKIIKCNYEKIFLEEGVELTIGVSYRTELLTFLESRIL